VYFWLLPINILMLEFINIKIKFILNIFTTLKLLIQTKVRIYSQMLISMKVWLPY